MDSGAPGSRRGSCRLGRPRHLLSGKSYLDLAAALLTPDRNPSLQGYLLGRDTVPGVTCGALEFHYTRNKAI